MNLNTSGMVIDFQISDTDDDKKDVFEFVKNVFNYFDRKFNIKATLGSVHTQIKQDFFAYVGYSNVADVIIITLTMF